MREIQKHQSPNSMGISSESSRLQDKNGEEASRDALFRQIVESAPVAHFVTDGRHFLYANPAFEALTGYKKEALSLVRPCDFFAQEISNSISGWVVSKHDEPLSTRLETRIITRDGDEKWITLTTTPIDHMDEPALLGTLMDITEYKQREEALQKLERRYRTVFEFAPDTVIIYSVEGRIIDVNPVGAKLLGVSQEEAIGRNGPMELWTKEESARFEEILENTLREGEWIEEIEGVDNDGRSFISESNVKVAEIDGETVVICISRDVTDRKKMEEQIRFALREKETLLREIHHRVKNNMQIISTLLKLQLKNAEDEKTKALFRESQNRILSMAMVHEKLYQSEGIHKIDLNDYISDLAREVFASFGANSERISLRFDVENTTLDMDTAIPCGLIIIELISNSLKYAFPKSRRGRIFIGIRSEDQGRFQLTVNDDGVGFSHDIDITRLKSLGFRLVSDLARYQLEGEMDVSREGGTTVHVRFQEREKYPKQNDHE